MLFFDEMLVFFVYDYKGCDSMIIGDECCDNFCFVKIEWVEFVMLMNSLNFFVLMYLIEVLCINIFGGKMVWQLLVEVGLCVLFMVMDELQYWLVDCVNDFVIFDVCECDVYFFGYVFGVVYLLCGQFEFWVNDVFFDFSVEILIICELGKIFILVVVILCDLGF